MWSMQNCESTTGGCFVALIIILIGLATLDLVNGDSFSNQFKRASHFIVSRFVARPTRLSVSPTTWHRCTWSRKNGRGCVSDWWPPAESDLTLAHSAPRGTFTRARRSPPSRRKAKPPASAFLTPEIKLWVVQLRLRLVVLSLAELH